METRKFIASALARRREVPGEAVDDAAHLRGGFPPKRIDSTSSCASRSWMTTGRPRRRARRSVRGRRSAGCPGGSVPIKIEPRFPDRHHLVAPGERLEAREERVGEPPRVVRWQADDGVDPRVPVGDRHRPLAALRVDADRGDPGDPRVRARSTTASSASRSGERSRCAWVSKYLPCAPYICGYSDSGLAGGFHSATLAIFAPLAAIPLDAIPASLHTPLRGTPRCAPRFSYCGVPRQRGAHTGRLRLRDRSCEGEALGKVECQHIYGAGHSAFRLRSWERRCTPSGGDARREPPHAPSGRSGRFPGDRPRERGLPTASAPRSG